MEDAVVKRSSLNPPFKSWPRWALVGLVIVMLPIFLLDIWYRVTVETFRECWTEIKSLWSMDR